jgi:hypothetical protein
MFWFVTADLVTLIHAAIVAFVVFGTVAIVVGWKARWHWVRNFYFRVLHLAMILFVCGESLVGATCPLTVWENALRVRGGESGYSRDFIGYWLDWLIFYQAPLRVFTAAYLMLGALLILAFWLVPVNWPNSVHTNRSAGLPRARRIR